MKMTADTRHEVKPAQGSPCSSLDTTPMKPPAKKKSDCRQQTPAIFNFSFGDGPGQNRNSNPEIQNQPNF